jgi:glucans biosynthesis protein
MQSYPSLSRFDFAGIRGFGLLQRNRRAEAYLDNEAKYHLRPIVWIEPRGEWSDGAVELLELPSQQESIDNIAAWWKPNKPVAVGVPMDLAYTVAFMSGEPEHAVARALTTRVTRRDGQPIRVEIDFAGSRLSRLPVDAGVGCEVKALRGAVSNIGHVRQADGSWRVRFDVRPAGREPVELRASLAREGTSLTERWRYLCPI